jgi:uncharacterized protein
VCSIKNFPPDASGTKLGHNRDVATENPSGGAAIPVLRVGIVSDTHGLVRPELIENLRGVNHILHAGDIGAIEVLDTLSAIAPVDPVRGNVDRDPWARRIPSIREVTIAGLRFLVIHNLHELDHEKERSGIDVIVFGHSHMPEIQKRGRALAVNPGSAGPRRFHLPVSMAIVTIRDGKAEAELIRLVD